MTDTQLIQGYYLLLNDKVISNSDLTTYMSGTVSDAYSAMATAYNAGATSIKLADYASTGEYVDALFQYELGRLPAATGKTHHVNAIDAQVTAGTFTDVAFITTFTQSALTDNANDTRFVAYMSANELTSAVAANGTTNNKVDVSEDFIATFTTNENTAAATEVLESITDDTTTVTAITNLIDQAVAATGGSDFAAALNVIDTLEIDDANAIAASVSIVAEAITTATELGKATLADEIILKITDVAATTAAVEADATLINLSAAAAATAADEVTAATTAEEITAANAITAAATAIVAVAAVEAVGGDTTATLAALATATAAAEDAVAAITAINEVANTSASETLAGTSGVDSFSYDYASAVQLNASNVQIAGTGAGEDGTDTITGFTIGTDTITFNDISAAVTTQAGFEAVSGITVINSGAALNFYFSENTSGDAAPILSIDNFLQDAVDAGFSQAANGINTLQEFIDIAGVANVSFTDTIA